MSAYWTTSEHYTEYDDWINDLLANAPEGWNDDAAAEDIITRYVHALEDLIRSSGMVLPREENPACTECPHPSWAHQGSRCLACEAKS